MAKLILPVVLVLLAGYGLTLYNSFVRLRQRVRNAWAQIDVQLKRRHDLIPNLINTVKGYAAHEQEVLAAVTEARASAMTEVATPGEQGRRETMLSGALGSLFAVAENYPQLQADSSFVKLQSELSDTESKISFSRQFYNDTVQRYNTTLEVFPNSLLAGAMGFQALGYFDLEAEPEARNPIKVDF